jgi:hypothetical protein
MNAYPPGTRVFFWNVDGSIIYGMVESVTSLSDGTQLAVVHVDEALSYEEMIGVEGVDEDWIMVIVRICLPISSMSKVT